MPNANARYNEAQKRLREKHPEEFAELLAAVYAEHGLTYRRRRTPDERATEETARRKRQAQRKVQSLIDEFGADVIPTTTAV